MIVLDATTKSIEIKLAGAVTTNQLQWMASFVEASSTPLRSNDGVTNGATAVTLVAGPASASTPRLVKGIQVTQADTVPAVVTIRLNNSGTFRTLFVATLGVGANLVFDGDKFSVYDASGNLLMSTGVTEANLSLSDVTTDDVTSARHGFAPKSPADATKFLNGAATPAYAQVKDSDLSTSDITTNNVSTTKHGFAPKGPNDATQYLDGTGSYSDPFDYVKLQVFG